MIQTEFVGIDIAKLKFDIALKSEKKWIESQFENNEAGHTQFLVWLNNHTNQPFVCLESTGSYGEILAEFLVKNKMKVSVVNPAQIKYYAKSQLTRNKNDRVDARIISMYAEKFTPRLYIPKSADQRFAKESIQFVDTLQEQKQQLHNQLESIRSKLIRKEMKRAIQSIEKRIAKIEEATNQCIQDNEEYSANKQRLLTVKGIGEKTAHRIIAYIPDIREFDNAKQLAAYAGLSPKQYQSGKFTGKTTLSKCGDPVLRKALYFPALVAKNKNPHLKAFCERLKKNGLKPKQIICAVMRKLIHIIFGMLKHQSDFNPALVSK